jgi:hypothetical protein
MIMNKPVVVGPFLLVSCWNDGVIAALLICFHYNRYQLGCIVDRITRVYRQLTRRLDAIVHNSNFQIKEFCNYSNLNFTAF